MIRTQIYIPDDLYKEAKLYAKLQKTTISHFVREGLRASLETQKKKNSKKLTLLDIAGSMKWKRKTNAAQEHNDIYDI